MKNFMIKKIIIFILVWVVAILIFFPIYWMISSGFKNEVDVFAKTPKIFFKPTINTFLTVIDESDYFKFALNSIITSFTATLISLTLAIPAAYVMSFWPTSRTKFTMLWMLSTNMMPAVGVLMPIFIIYKTINLLDTKLGLIIIFSMVNLPFMVWMLYTFFKELPYEILEAARVDGANIYKELIFIVLPTSYPGIVSASFLSIIFCWNESFWSITLSAANSAPLTAFMASFANNQGLFWAKLSAASTMTVIPIMIIGWLAQKHLVRGLTFGAVK